MKATRGNLVENAQLEELREKDSIHQADVMRILGTPSSTAIFDDTVWYYVGMRTEQSAFLDPEVKEKRVVALYFNEEGILQNVSEIDHEGYDVPLTDRKTPTTGQNITVLQQLLGNIGKFNPQAIQ